MEEKTELWFIPLDEYFIQTCTFPMRNKFMELDGIGFLLEYDNNNPKKFDPDFIRHHLQGKRSTWAYIEAKTKEEAIEKFYKEYDGASIGTKRRALRITNINKITKVIHCDKRCRNKRNEFTCGEPVADNPEHWVFEDDKENLNGVYGMCYLEGYDLPEMCPANDEEPLLEEHANLLEHLDLLRYKGNSKSEVIKIVITLLDMKDVTQW